MIMSGRTKIVYVTSNPFKIEENKLFVEHCKFKDNEPVNKHFEFDVRTVSIPEMLEVDIERMVQAEVRQAYAQIRLPCIVEHAGLVFDDFKADWYPGGLTKPMWNTLKDKFVEETASANRRATARAVVAYCDGMNVHSFIGETSGRIADMPRGNWKFYWDTVFIPDDPTGMSIDKTYAEIHDDPTLGLMHKVVHLSQSTRAMLSFLEWRREQSQCLLWQYA